MVFYVGVDRLVKTIFLRSNVLAVLFNKFIKFSYDIALRSVDQMERIPKMFHNFEH